MMLDVIIVCAWCKKKMKKGKNWIELDPTILSCGEAVISHGVCPDCEKKMRQEMRLELANRIVAAR